MTSGQKKEKFLEIIDSLLFGDIDAYTALGNLIYFKKYVGRSAEFTLSDEQLNFFKKKCKVIEIKAEYIKTPGFWM